jgi:ABC-2 type transport system permease protein
MTSITSRNNDVRRGWLLPVGTLTLRELVRFLRQRSRVTGALLQPIIFWVLFGVGLSGSFRMPGAGDGGLSYQAYFIPGIAAMIVLFTAIFSSISVIQDRNEGFLQGVLVAPVPRAALVLGKLAGGTVLAVAQAVLFIALAFVLHAAGLAPSLALGFSFLRVLGVLLLLVLMGLGLCGLGYFFAWKLDSSQGFHAIMSVLLFPMWLLSGAFFPAEGSGWLRYIIAANPLTYGVAGLRRLMFPESSAALPSLAICFAVTAAFALVCIVVDAWLTRRSPGT